MSIYEAFVVMGIGGTALVASLQMENQIREMGIVGPMGPAKWTVIIGLILFVCGISQVIAYVFGRRSAETSLPTATASRNVSGRAVILVVLLGAWVAAAPTLGYNVTNLCVLPMIFYVAGFRPWFKSIAAGFIMTVLFYVIFVLGAKMSVPKGGIGLL